MTYPRIASIAFLGLLTPLVAPGAARGQPLTERTPNMSGTWVTSPSNLHFQFAHRFQVVGDDANITDLFGSGKIVNYPTFDVAVGLFDGAMAGVRYSSNSPGAGLVNEWQPYFKYAPLRGVGNGIFSVAVTGAWNGANHSLDGEIATETRAGPLRLLGAVRGFSDIYDLPDGVSDEALALAAGAALHLNRYISVAGDIADIVAGPDGDAAWSAGLHLGIPFTPHTFSIMVTNVTSGTLAGSSAGVRTFLPDGAPTPIFWGFEFTVPFSGFARWGKIFSPGDSPAKMSEAPPGVRVVEVDIRGVAYRTPEIHVPPGTVVRWLNKDPIGHTATAADGSWSSALIGPGEVYERTFDRPGRYEFYCIPHPFMTGVVIVEGG